MPYITSSVRMPGFDLGQQHFELYGLEPVHIQDSLMPLLSQLPFYNHLAIEEKPEMFKKRYFKGCLEPRIQAKRVLICRYGGIGDIQWIIPCLRAIKEYNKLTEIRFACFEKDREMFIHCNLIDSIISTKYPTLQDLEWADYVLDFFDTVEGIGENEAKNRSPIDISLEIVGLKPSSYLGYYEITAEEKEYARAVLNRKVGEKILALPLVASSPHRSWNNQEEIIEYLAKNNKDFKCVILADETPHSEGLIRRIRSRDFKNVIDFTKQTTLRQMVAICNEADITISNDTGIVNILATLQKKVIALYSTVPAKTRVKYYDTVYPLEVKKSCSPCYYLSQECKSKNNCLNTISAKEIYNKIQEILK